MKEIDKMGLKILLANIDKVRTGRQFPQKMVSDDYAYSCLFDFETIFSKDFFDVIKEILKEKANDCFYVIVAEPDPLNYFFKNFNKLPVISITSTMVFQEYVEILNSDPGGSPADALIFNSNILYVVSEDLQIIYFFDRKKEIGVGYYSSQTIYDLAMTKHKYGVITPSDQATIPDFLTSTIKQYEVNHIEKRRI
jgi:hypothetical protein